MRVLAINAGSATLKFGVFESARTLPLIDSAIDHPAVDAATFEEIERHLHRAGVTTLDGIGHRVAHGGPLLSNAVLVDEEVEREIGKASALAPHHNPAALAGIRLTRERWPGVRHVAVFDTAFHDDMPEYAHSYAVPPSWRAAGVRRYGFHGLSHQGVLAAVSTELKRPPSELRIVSCHIGSGASVCAIDRGRSVDTSMGMTALEGLVMGTRCGDLDPGVPGFVARALGESSDLRIVEKRAGEGVAAAQLAMQVHAYRVRKYIGAYAAAMGGCDAVAFTGGAGENSAALRRRIVDGLEFIGLELDEERNRAYSPNTEVAQLQSSRSAVAVLVVQAREQLAIARETFRALNDQASGLV
jgi:acetate kinase